MTRSRPIQCARLLLAFSLGGALLSVEFGGYPLPWTSARALAADEDEGEPLTDEENTPVTVKDTDGEDAPKAAASAAKTARNDAPSEGQVKKGSREHRSDDDLEQAAEAEQMRLASATHVRRFHEVLDELLAEFGYDVKSGQIKGLSNLSIRKIRVSDAIPKTYEEYVEMLLAERIRENSQIRLIDCVPCKTRTSSLVDGRLMITSPSTNVAKLDSAAAQLNIENFMDAVLVYHTTHMVLAVDVFNSQTKELVWARTYNSETIRTRYQKLAVDYRQVEKARPGEDYVPEYRYMFGLGGGGVPNVGGTTADSTMLNLQIRATERFNNRHDEFGMLLSILKSTNSLQKPYPTQGDSTSTSANPPETVTKSTGATPKPFQQALGIYGLYSHLFIGAIESYNDIRHGAHFGIGGLLASSYIAPAFRAGWDVFLGRRFSVSFGGNYIAPSSILVGSTSVKTAGGPGADVVMSLNY